jgi:hypothetical protein
LTECHQRGQRDDGQLPVSIPVLHDLVRLCTSGEGLTRGSCGSCEG